MHDAEDGLSPFTMLTFSRDEKRYVHLAVIVDSDLYSVCIES